MIKIDGISHHWKYDGKTVCFVHLFPSSFDLTRVDFPLNTCLQKESSSKIFWMPTTLMPFPLVQGCGGEVGHVWSVITKHTCNFFNTKSETNFWF